MHRILPRFQHIALHIPDSFQVYFTASDRRSNISHDDSPESYRGPVQRMELYRRDVQRAAVDTFRKLLRFHHISHSEFVAHFASKTLGLNPRRRQDSEDGHRAFHPRRSTIRRCVLLYCTLLATSGTLKQSLPPNYTAI